MLFYASRNGTRVRRLKCKTSSAVFRTRIHTEQSSIGSGSGFCLFSWIGILFQNSYGFPPNVELEKIEMNIMVGTVLSKSDVIYRTGTYLTTVLKLSSEAWNRYGLGAFRQLK
jgi:hypothetical protein